MTQDDIGLSHYLGEYTFETGASVITIACEITEKIFLSHIGPGWVRNTPMGTGAFSQSHYSIRFPAQWHEHNLALAISLIVYWYGFSCVIVALLLGQQYWPNNLFGAILMLVYSTVLVFSQLNGSKIFLFCSAKLVNCLMPQLGNKSIGIHSTSIFGVCNHLVISFSSPKCSEIFILENSVLKISHFVHNYCRNSCLQVLNHFDSQDVLNQ